MIDYSNINMKTNKRAVYAVNKMTRQLLAEVLGWTADKYGGNQPMTASNSESELAKYDLPYVVYGYSIRNSGLTRVEQVAYSILSRKTSDIDNALALLQEAFDRDAVSAYELNEIKGEGYEAYAFKTTRLVNAVGPDEEDQVGGRHMGFIIVEYEYTYNPKTNEDNTFFQKI